MDQEESITNSVDLTTQIKANTISAIQIDSFLNNLYVGTTDGKIYNWDIKNKFKPELQEVAMATANSNAGITSLGFLTGSRSLFVGQSDGTSSIWFPARDENGKPVLTRVHEFDKLEGQITGFAKSPRDRGFVINDFYW